jgi:type II secretory pathway component PulF
MPVYTYKAKKGPKELVQGELEAASQDNAVARLEEMGLTPVNVVAKGVERDNKKLETAFHRGGGTPVPPPRWNAVSGLGRVRTRDIDTFTRQMASLIRAGVPVANALSLIAGQSSETPLGSVVSGLEKEVKDGKMLSEAMGKYRNLFNNLYLSLVKSGEKAGVLDETLTRLASHREKEDEIRRRIQAALAYPLLIITVGIATVFIMLTYFLPKLVGLFENMRQALPIPTKILIGMSGFFSANWYWILMALVLAGAIFGRVKPGSKKKFVFDMIKLHVPFVNKFIMDAEAAKFTKTLGLLLESGVPIHQSLELATKTLDNDALREGLSTVSREIVSQGSSLSGSLKRSRIFPAFVTNMIAVGEEGGKLEGALREVTSTYEKEVEQAMKIATALLEPILILVVGSVVGFIVFAMLLPIFNIGIMGG